MQLSFAMVVLTGVLSALPAAAAIVSFSGTRANINTLNPPGTGRCAPLNTVNIAPGALSSTGTSNFGSFASTQSHCIAGAPTPMTPVQPTSDGIVRYDFVAGDTLFGTFTGSASLINGAVVGLENLVATGGTGRFAGATGGWTAIGSLAFVPNPNGGPGFVGVYDGAFEGLLNLPAVPEPTAWALLITGFGLTGAAARRRRQASVA